jgi:NAD(P)-dependent dehydrogenase (short-subunit alcohol dehydrogenase family)
MREKVCIVTGANGGIGRETAFGLARQGATVVLACRDPSRAELARREIAQATRNEQIHALPLELAAPQSIDAFVSAFSASFGRLDVLINNAGVICRQRRVTQRGDEATFATNYLGPFKLTRALLPLIVEAPAGRIVSLSSSLHVNATLEWDDLLFERRPYRAFEAYKQSKLAIVVFIKALARRLHGTRAVANAVHPGVAGSDITRDYGKVGLAAQRLLLMSPRRAAMAPLHLATSAAVDAVSGEYFDRMKRVPSSPLADDREAQDRLWQLSERWGLAV